MVVDDDPLARRMLQNLCAQDQRLDLAGICDSAAAAQARLAEIPIDLLFLDIEMPGQSGLDLLEQLPYQPQIIITTVNKDYAFEAFEHQVTDFLHKPIHHLRFTHAIERALLFHRRLQQYQTHRDHLFVREEGQYIRLQLDDILYFESVGDYVRIATPQRAYLTHGTLKAIDQKLNEPRFLRVHRSYIVNLDQVRDIQESTLVIDRQVIPVSRANRPVLMSRINLL